MRPAELVLALAAVFVLAGQALAIPMGHAPIVFKNMMGDVTMTPEMHLSKGLTCADCHKNLKPVPFTMKFGADRFTMDDIRNGRYCGSCHNGKKAFAPAGNCAKCHNNGKNLK